MNIVCCALIVDDCDMTAAELEDHIKGQSTFLNKITVTDAYYPKQRIIKMQTFYECRLALLALRTADLVGPEDASRLYE